jgi:hypothetical protein
MRTNALALLRRKELLIAVAAVLALWIVRRAWNVEVSGAALALPGYVGAGVLLGSAFSLLVLERHLEGRGVVEWPESISLAPRERGTAIAIR